MSNNNDNLLKGLWHAHNAREQAMEAARRVSETNLRQANRLAKAARLIDSVTEKLRAEI
jgi:hypothetical protein